MQELEERLPYVRFERRPIQRVDQVGVQYFEEVDFILITPAGSRDCTEQKAEAYLAERDRLVRMKRFPAKLLDEMKRAYKQFQDGEDITRSGTPIVALGLTKGQMDMLKLLNTTTVEDLAAANEELMGRIGMGGRALKARAILFLENKPKAESAQEIAALRQENASLRESVQGLEKNLAVVQRMLEVTHPAAASVVANSRESEDNVDMPDREITRMLSDSYAQIGQKADEES